MFDPTSSLVFTSLRYLPTHDSCRLSVEVVMLSACSGTRLCWILRRYVIKLRLACRSAHVLRASRQSSARRMPQSESAQRYQVFSAAGRSHIASQRCIIFIFAGHPLPRPHHPGLAEGPAKGPRRRRASPRGSLLAAGDRRGPHRRAGAIRHPGAAQASPVAVARHRGHQQLP